MKSFERPGATQEVEVTAPSFLEQIRQKFEKQNVLLKYFIVGTLATVVLDAVDVKPKPAAKTEAARLSLPQEKAAHEKAVNMVTCEIGHMQPVTLELWMANHVGHSWNEEKIELADPEVKKFVEYTQNPLNNEQGFNNAPLEDEKAFGEFIEGQLKDAKLLAKCGVEDADHVQNPTPEQAVALAQHIILDNTAYSSLVSKFNKLIETLQKGDERNQLGALPRETIREIPGIVEEFHKKLDEMNAIAPDTAYTKGTEIMCTNAARLFKENMEYLKAHHGKNLKNVYVGCQIGAASGTEDPLAKNHIWNKISHVIDENGDGVADTVELTYIDATPLTVAQKAENPVITEEAEILQGIRSVADLHRGKLLSEEQYQSIVADFDRVVQEGLAVKGITGDDAKEARVAILKEFSLGATSPQEKELFVRMGASL